MGGMPPTSIPGSNRLEIFQRGRNWVLFRSHTEIGGRQARAQGFPMIPVVTERVAAPGLVGGTFIAPEDLAKLKPGQVIDEKDKWTYVSLRVAHKGPLGGRKTVVLREESPIFTVDYHYDMRSGGLVRVHLTDRKMAGMTTEIIVRLESVK